METNSQEASKQGGSANQVPEKAVQKEDNPQIGKDKAINDKTLSAGHSSDISDQGKKTEGNQDKNVPGQAQSNMDGNKVEPKDQNRAPIAGVSDAAQVSNQQPVEGTGSEHGAADPSSFSPKPQSNTEPTKKL